MKRKVEIYWKKRSSVGRAHCKGMGDASVLYRKRTEAVHNCSKKHATSLYFV